MSAYIISKRHLDALVAAAQHYTKDVGLRWTNGSHTKVYTNNAVETQVWNGQAMSWSMIAYNAHGEDALGGLLWSENQQSVAERYPDDHEGTWPGPCGLTTADILAYTYTPPQRMPSPVEALKLLACYEYQACEHREWKQSAAKAICEQLRSAFISALPGYDEAPWGLD